MNKNNPLRNVLIVVAIGGSAFVLYSIFKTVKAGISDIVGAPAAIWNGLKNDATALVNSVTGLFSGSSSTATPQNITLTDASGQPVGTVLATSPLNGLFAADPLDQPDQSAAIPFADTVGASASSPVWTFNPDGTASYVSP